MPAHQFEDWSRVPLRVRGFDYHRRHPCNGWLDINIHVYSI
jgi:hypothetical protein